MSAKSFRNVLRVPVGAHAEEQLRAIADFRARDTKVKAAVNNVKTKAAEVSNRSTNRQNIDQWISSCERLLQEENQREMELAEAWSTLEENLFRMSEEEHSSSSSSSSSSKTINNNKEALHGLTTLRVSIKSESEFVNKASSKFAEEREKLKKQIEILMSTINNNISNNNNTTLQKINSSRSSKSNVTTSTAAGIINATRKINSTTNNSNSNSRSSSLNKARSTRTTSSNSYSNNNKNTTQQTFHSTSEEISDLKQQEEKLMELQKSSLEQLDKEFDSLTQELLISSSQEQQQQQQTDSVSQNNNNNILCLNIVPWFLEFVSAPRLSLVSKLWLDSYKPIEASSPEMFIMFKQHQESQQVVLDEIARAANATREALLECGPSRDIERLWNLWQCAPAIVPGGKSRRDRVISAAKAEELFDSSSSSSSSSIERALEFLIELWKQKQQLRSRYSSSTESVMQQMKRLDEVVIALQTLQEAESVHSTFLTQLEQDSVEVKARAAKLQAEKDEIEAQRAAEAAIEAEKEKERMLIVKEREHLEAVARQEAVAKWIEEKQEKQRQFAEIAAQESQREEQDHQELLRHASQRVAYRAAVGESKQAEKQMQLDTERIEQESKEEKLREFYAKQEERVGVTKDPNRILSSTASFETSAALPSVGESCAKFGRTGHGFSSQAIVSDARFKLHEALSMAGLQNTNYARTVLHDTFTSHAKVGKMNQRS